jgi:multiple sugar transport system substrate-binding protein
VASEGKNGRGRVDDPARARNTHPEAYNKSLQREMMMKRFLSYAVTAGFLAAGGPAVAQETLNVWWVKGFYKSEDDALFAAIKKFEEQNGVKVELSQYPVQDMIPKTVAALDSGTPPDVAYADVYDFQVTGKWAFDGKLADISDIIEPMKADFAPNTVETTYLWNDQEQKRAYYAFPLKRQTMHIQYWIDMLEGAGFTTADVPKEWDAFWNFWCEEVQPGARKATGERVYGIGAPMGVDSSDSFYSFLTFMDAYNVKLVDEEGKLLVDDPAVREGLIGALTSYTKPYLDGCVPQSATSWKDPDNNVAFHNKTTVLTHNATISIAAKWLDDSKNETLTQEERDQALKNYSELIATAPFPSKPDGSPMVYRQAVKTGVIFADAPSIERAKEFVSFLLKDENLRPYVEGSLGRWFPVTNAAVDSPFWQEDRHRQAVHAQFSAGTVNFEFTKNYRFTILNNENVWAKAMSRIVTDGISVEEAADELIARIKEVAG